jgi:hypothetical protein
MLSTPRRLDSPSVTAMPGRPLPAATGYGRRGVRRRMLAVAASSGTH